MNDQVDILLSTFNGEKFIREQIDSLLKQTYQNIRIIIGDDRSSDNTLSIIREYVESYPDKIVMIAFKNNVSASLNFSRLTDYADAKYIMFCDQDDVWLPNKVELSLKKMKAMEAIYGDDTPILVFTDLIVVDEELQIINKSIMRYLNMRSGAKAINRFLIENNSWGCTMIINKMLMQTAFPIPIEANMYDGWIGLTANAIGKVCYIPEGTLYYRQHADNFFGAKNQSYFKRTLAMFSNPREVKSVSQWLYSHQIQALAFYTMNHQLLDEKQREIFRAFISLRNHSYPRTLYSIFKFCFFRSTFWSNMWLLIGIYLSGPLPEKHRLIPR